MGTEDIKSQLRELGYEPVDHGDQFVGFRFTIPHGRFRGREVDIALQAPQFPDIPPTGPYIKPFLLPIKPQQGPHPDHGVHDWKKPTPEFQYWSRPCNGWDNTEKTMKTYLSFLRTLFDFE